MSTFSPADEAAQLIDRLERLVRAGEAIDGLKPAQWEALRYIARANRFSRTPAALADYLGATRGTVSQTLIALEQKGHLTRSPSPRDGRAIDVTLTPRGRRLLADDPLNSLAADLAANDADTLTVLVGGLRAALHAHITRNGGRAFGACHTCRHFQRNYTPTGRAPHHCALLDEPLSEGDSNAICCEQEPQPA